MDEYQKAVARIADHALAEARKLATHLGEAIRAPESKVFADVLDAINERRPVGVQLERDKRATYWRARVRLYGPDGALEADSDADLPPDAPGEALLRGLTSVPEWAGEMVLHFHKQRGERADWIDNATARKKLRSLRPTLSRQRGKATWRLEYAVDSRPWKAFIDVERVAA